MSDTTAFSFDENTRRYYLDAMGIQCWALREVPGNAETGQVLKESQHVENNRDVTSTDSVSGDSEPEHSWTQLETAIQKSAHQFGNTRKQAIVGRGNQSAELMFVVFAPDSQDDEAGIICSGEANALFSKMLSAIHIAIDDVYITSLLKHHVTEEYTVSINEIKVWRTHLEQQIQLIQPKRLIVLGEATAHYLLQKNKAIDDFRALNTSSSFQINSIPVFISYSPRELLQQPAHKRKAWEDLQQLQGLLSVE